MTRPVVLFLIGAPGVGKTALARELLGQPESFRHSPWPLGFKGYTEPPLPKWTLADDAGATVAGGWYKGETFDGGDTVPYTGARKALEYWRDHLAANAKLTILDGARFGTGPSSEFVRVICDERGYKMTGIYLVASDDVLASRRAGRGSHQAASWIKGATTASRNFAARIGAVELPAHLPVGAVAELARRHVENCRSN